MTMRIRTHKNKTIIYTICFIATMFLFILSYISASLDETNMVNNGYVSKDAIAFKMTSIDQPLKTTSDKFILVQYEASMPGIRIVRMNGDLKMPPIQFISKDSNNLSRGNIAIVGINAPVNNLPSSYPIAGYFDTPTSYLMNAQIWLITEKMQINVEEGNMFIFESPSNNKIEILKAILNNNSFEIIHAEEYGSYAMNSNKSILRGLQLTSIFFIMILMIFSWIWFSKEKKIIQIMYIHGFPMLRIYREMVITKVLPCTVSSTLTMLIIRIIQQKKFTTWDSAWVVHSMLTVVAYVVFLFIVSFIVTARFSIGKGGRKY